ncbi:hypothetical protein pb186bvf_002438 [Paramecium bursaria]
MKQENNGIKIIPNDVYPHKEERSNEFQKLFDQTQAAITEEGLDNGDFQLEILYHKDVLKPQNWIFKFKGEPSSIYNGKVIKGMLQFPDTYPSDFPQFYFNQVKKNNYQGNFGFPIHENIYGSGLLCIPMLSSNIWNPATKPVDMLKAISFIFHNPNPNDPANPTFPKDPIQIAQVRKELADALDEE